MLKAKELTDDERQVAGKKKKMETRALSKIRVIVENIIGDIKVSKIMSGRYRHKKIRSNLKFKIISGIINLKNGFA